MNIFYRRLIVACLGFLISTCRNYASDIELLNNTGIGSMVPPIVSTSTFALHLNKSKRVVLEIINNSTGKVIASDKLDIESGHHYQIQEHLSIEKQKLHIAISINNGNSKISGFDLDRNLDSDERSFFNGPNFGSFNIPSFHSKYLVISNVFFFRALKPENAVYVSTSAPIDADPSVSGTSSLTLGQGTSLKDVNDALSIAIAVL